MRLWDAEGISLDEAILTFTVGEDPILDLELLVHDCVGSAAHARVLAEAGFIEADEIEPVIEALRDAHRRAWAREMAISTEQEDCHTALEAFLTERLGETGRKIHTGRSRNDQVITALRLLVRERLLGLTEAIAGLVETLTERTDAHARTLMPGYTHTRQAMPSSVGQLFGAAAEGLLADLGAFEGALSAANRGALGSASGYGVPLPLDRELAARLLGFSGVDANTLFVQNTRGRLEATVIATLYGVASTLGRWATDLIWFSSEAFAFFRLPQELTTGSSIMPNKRNPDLLELVRALPATLQGAWIEITSTLHGLPFGYHRDLQRTKSPLLRSLDLVDSAVAVMTHAAQRLEVDEQRCRDALEAGIYATDRAYELVREGVPFREAYRRIKAEGAEPVDHEAVFTGREHVGAVGTEQGEALRVRLGELRSAWQPYADGAAAARRLLAAS